MKKILNLLVLVAAIAVFYSAWLLGKQHHNTMALLQQSFDAQRNENALLQSKVTALGNTLQVYAAKEYSPVIVAQSPSFAPLRARLEEMEIRLKDLVSSMSVNLTVIDSSRTKLIRDTILNDGVLVFNDTLGYLKLKGYADMKNGLLNYQYRYDSDLEIVTHRYRKYFWQPYQTRVSVLNCDPKATVRLEPIVIKSKERRFSLGLFGGYGVVLNQNRIVPGPVIGGGINYRIW